MPGAVMIVQLPNLRGTPRPYRLRPAFTAAPVPGTRPCFSRLAYAAAHVVAKPANGAAAADPRSPDSVDWDATLRFRRHLWHLGFGIAEAMDTAQREILGWENAARLLDMTLADARAEPGRGVIGGAGTDTLATSTPTLRQVIDAYVAQAEFIHERGGRVILFPTHFLPRHFPAPGHYLEVYRAVTQEVSKPVFLHWLGDMFAPALRGYFPGDSFRRITQDNPKVLGVKLSLLDQRLEEAIRRRIAPQGQVVLTGDDFNFPALIRGGKGAGDGRGFQSRAFHFEGRGFPVGDYSHGLLGIFDGIARVASRALICLAQGDAREYDRLMAPTVPLSRHIFKAPTQHYKAGLVFLAYLNGHQSHFHLLADAEQRRDMAHYVELFKLANAAGVLDDPESAYERFQPVLRNAGF
jgi:hypothetical protein